MNPIVASSIDACVFAAVSWLGALAGTALCAGRVPHDDGPSPVTFARWPFPVAGGAIGLMLAAHADSPGRLAVLAFAVLGLAGCTAADLTCGMLPDLLTLAPLALAIGSGLLAHDLTPALGAAFVALPFAGAALFSRGRGMGWGDVKLAALGGALLGARDATLAFVLAAIVAYVVTRRTGRARTPIAFGPYLAGSIVVTLATVARGV